MASTEFEESALDAALDRGFLASTEAPTGSGDEAFVSAVVDSLTGTTTPGTEVPVSSSSGGSSGFLILLVIVGGLVLLVWVAVRKGKKSAVLGRDKLIAEAKTEIRAQLDAMANTILEITDLVNASSDTQDDTYLREASATYTTADDSFAAANDLNALEALSDRLDEARWQLDAAAAIASGKPVPRGRRRSSATSASSTLRTRTLPRRRKSLPRRVRRRFGYAPWMRRSCGAAPSRSRE